jgi:hypothetical protein
MFLESSVSSFRSRLLKIVLYALVCASVFDPADLIFHAKVPLFILSWVVFLLGASLDSPKSAIRRSTLMYVFFFVAALPALSISVSFLSGSGAESFDGFSYWKGFLYLSVTLILVLEDIDLIPSLSYCLSILALSVAAVYLITNQSPIIAVPLAIWGNRFGVFAITERSYGTVDYRLIYFHASPLLVISISYFSYRFCTTKGSTRAMSLALLLLSVFGMFKGGTRNNIIFSVLTPILIFSWYSRRRVVLLSIGGILLLGLAIANISAITAATDARELSNHIKLQHVVDYMATFDNPKQLMLGSGIGSRFFSHGFGTYTSVTELTYFELIRSFGLLLGSAVILAFVSPLWHLSSANYYRAHYLLIAYGVYLLLCTTNPLLFSSSGMLLLSIVLSEIHRVRREAEGPLLNQLS